MIGSEQRKTLHDFIAAQHYAVVSTVSESGAPEAALVGIAVTPDLEIVFETTDATRKFGNLRHDPRIALVIGWGDERTLQYEGIADEPTGGELERLKMVFFAMRPDLQSHETWPGVTYFRVKPKWIRFSSYYRPRSIEEIAFEADEKPQPPLHSLLEKLRALAGAA